MKREMGFGRCGLACCLCGNNDTCGGCGSGNCPDTGWCVNRRCSMEKGLPGCYACKEDCRKGMLGKDKPYGFTAFLRRYGEMDLLDCLERNERAGVVYHRAGVTGDYDGFADPAAFAAFVRTGKR